MALQNLIRLMRATLLSLLLGALAHAQTPGPVLRVVAGDHNDPYNFVLNGKVVGLGVDVADELLRRAGLQVPIEAFPWPRALALTEAVPDTLLFTVARTPEREAQFHWIGPFAEREIWMYRLVSRSDIKVTSLDDAKRYKVGISLADATATSLQSQGFVKGGNLDITTFAVDIVRKMKVGRVDLTPLNPYSLPTFARDAGVQPDQLEPIFLYTRDGGYYLALNKQSSPSLLAKLDAAFTAMVKDGGLAKIIERWRISQGLAGKVVKQGHTKK